jgi:hypothetical protein
VKTHKFAVGQTVHFSPGMGGSARGGSLVFKVVRLLPAEHNDQQYRVKSTLDGHERVVKESQLS